MTNLKFYPKRLLRNMMKLTGILIIAWFVISLLQVYIHIDAGITSQSHSYSDWNAFFVIGRIIKFLHII